MDSKIWDKVYATKTETEVSWFQPVPRKSLDLVSELDLQPSDPIIDIGGGDSHFVDELLKVGFTDLSVLDISAEALNRLRQRLPKSAPVQYIVTDVTKFSSVKKFKLWHDRATFHFLTNQNDIEAYLKIASDLIEENGYLIVSTFSKSGPIQCSGLPITQYSETDLKVLFGKFFKNIKCFEDTHTTPWGAKQDFVYCGFKKL